MYILFEEHPYYSSLVEDILKDIYVLQDVDKKVCVQYVGYFYNPHLHDCVFILPKVLLTEQETLVGVKLNTDEGERDVTPEMVLTPKEQEKLSKEYRKFIYEFSVWIYRALSVFYKANPKSRAILYKHLPQAGRGRRHQAKTYLDIVLSLINFNKENRDFVLFTIKNIHRGNNKINWTRTISHSQAFLQDNDVVYLNPVNKKRIVNYEEELFIIFFSILNYLNQEYGFNTPINIQYELIKGKQFKQYLHGMGKTRLMQIKYKYFSDKALQLWDLCYAFFENSYRLAINTNAQEYILAKSFNIVFEAMIDELIGDKDLPDDLKVHRDDKRIDHLYTYKYLIENIDSNTELMTRDIYNIADSKYYKRDKELRGHDVPKQFTYARNVIQWHMDLLHDLLKNDVNKAQKYKGVKLFDEVTEGYNIIPNFFISGFVCDDLNDSKPELKFSTLGDGVKNPQECFFFWERLFDRNTFFTLHYDVNFLYVMKMYAQNKPSAKEAWKIAVRKEFREKALGIINDEFVFYQIIVPYDDKAEKPEDDKQIVSFVNKYFRQLLGKVFCFNDADGNRVLLYAERKNQEKGNGKSFIYIEDQCTHVDNGNLCIPTKAGVDQYKVIKVKLGESKYLNSNYAIVGYIKSDEQYKWIMENKIYNIPTTLRGKYQKLDKGVQLPSFLILRNEKLEIFIFDVVGTPIVKTKKEDLPKGSYMPGHPEYYIIKIDVNKRNDEVLETFAKSKYCKKLKKKSFAVNLSQLQLEAETAVETSSEPMKALLYKFEDKDVFYSMVAEGDVEYGDLD